VLRDEDVLGRFGGDEFVVVVSEPGGGPQGVAERLRLRLRDAMDEPVVVDGDACRLGASVGVAVFPDHGAAATDLLRQADAAMYEAKRARRAAHATSPAP
jgi:diguanylate cyclase (GGDEF)-like protein